VFDSSIGLDLDQLRERLKRFSDQELIRFGKASSYMCFPEAQPFGGKNPPDPVFVVQLEEARDEWRRRKKADDAPDSF